ncbi:MAG: lysophospholipid acyltransferase family protein [Labrys sp. (in: a-proteobacteria)]
MRLGVRAVAKILAVALVVLPLIPLQLLAIRRDWRIAGPIACFVLRWALLVMAVRVETVGAPIRDRPLLLVSNHLSWLDIPVIGALMPLSFVAKREVASWPVFGLLARLKRCVFIDRDRRHRTGAAAKEIGDRLAAGDAIVLFPEGTTSDGLRVLPFRSALIGAAREAVGRGDRPVMIQPFAVVYLRRGGLPIGRGAMAEIAWTGDEDLVPHLLGILNGGPIDAELRFGAPRAFDAATDRKALSRDLEQEVRRLMKGRPLSSPSLPDDGAVTVTPPSARDREPLAG